MERKNVNEFLKSGSLRGYFYVNEFWEFYENLKNDPLNKKFLSDKVEIGKSALVKFLSIMLAIVCQF